MDKKKVPPPPEYRALVEALAAQYPDVRTGAMFGMTCLKIHGKAFAGSYAGGAVFKLAPTEVAAALALPWAEPFDPSGRGAPMRAWAVLPVSLASHWAAFAESAIAFVSPV